jgi:hypothetical protein
VDALVFRLLASASFLLCDTVTAFVRTFYF